MPRPASHVEPLVKAICELIDNSITYDRCLRRDSESEETANMAHHLGLSRIKLNEELRKIL